MMKYFSSEIRNGLINTIINVKQWKNMDNNMATTEFEKQIWDEEYKWV